MQGVKADVERLTQNVGEKLVIESNLALKIGDYLIRRALFDTSRALTGGAAAFVAVLAPASSEETSEDCESEVSEEGKVADSSNAGGDGGGGGEPPGEPAPRPPPLDTDSPAPFAERARVISQTRALSNATSSADPAQAQLLLAATQASERNLTLERLRRETREQQLRQDAVELVQDAGSSRSRASPQSGAARRCRSRLRRPKSG